MKNLLALMILVGAVGSAHAALVYDNMPNTATYFYDPTKLQLEGDDFDIAPVGGNLPALITGINFGLYALAATSVDVRIQFYSDMDLSGATSSNVFGANPTPVASFLLGGLNLPAAGAYTTGLIPLGTNSFVLPAISNYATSNHGITFEFFNAGTTVRSTAATILFNGTAPTVGASEDVFFDDTNLNGSLASNEGFNYGGGAFRANFALQLDASPVPEPATLLILAAGIPALLRRRNKN